MIPTIQIEEARFTEVAERAVEREIGDGIRLAQACILEEILGAVFGSDIGHFDVQDMTEVLHEAYELVENEPITDTDFRDFVFTNPVRLWTANNPHFFKGTAVEKQASTILAAG